MALLPLLPLLLWLAREAKNEQLLFRHVIGRIMHALCDCIADILAKPKIHYKTTAELTLPWMSPHGRQLCDRQKSCLKVCFKLWVGSRSDVARRKIAKIPLVLHVFGASGNLQDGFETPHHVDYVSFPAMSICHFR